MARLKKRADGRYATKIYLGKDGDGKKRYKTVYASNIPDLKEKETEVRHKLGKGMDYISDRDTFARWATDWMEIKGRAKITDRQLNHYEVAQRYWVDLLGEFRVDEIRPDDIERGLLALDDQGLSQRTIHFYRSTIKQILDRAVGRVVPYNPALRISPDVAAVGRKKQDRRALTAAEQQWIWDTPHRAQPVAIIIMLSGLRRGELAALEWEDVDLDKGTITVNKVIEYDRHGSPTRRNFPKTESSCRVIDIPRKLVDYMAQMPRKEGQPLVIPSAAGGYMTTTGWTKLWRSYMRVLNAKYGERTEADKVREQSSKPGPKVYDMTIPPITLHWLRHTYCTLLYLSGVDVLQACAQMGHADVSTTLRIYTHLDAQHKRQSANKLDKYLSGKGVDGGVKIPEID